ncbi:DUF3298 domain-containing protein [Candidatus Poribacteria bacterium]|nr:DUF3298 domain-containing protein [Candidatus Poribacteria bacterium]
MSRIYISGLLIILAFLPACSNTQKNLPVIQTEVIREKPEDQPYYFDMEVPKVSGIKSKDVQKDIDSAINSIVNNVTEPFMLEAIKNQKAREETGSQPFSETPDVRSEVYIRYENYLVTASLISIRFSIQTYLYGMAHPDHKTKVLNYNIETAQFIELEDIFKPGTNYLETISQLTIEDLLDQFKEALAIAPEDMSKRFKEWINKGAAPEMKNYRNFLLSRDSLVIVFDPYQVASYADGTRVVKIPYTKLKNIINPEGPLKSLL